MAEMLGCCGVRCDMCPAYRENVTGPEHQERIAAGWKLFFKVDATAKDIYCDGCLDMRDDARRPNPECKIRPCVVEKGLANCGGCVDYPCKWAAGIPQRRADAERRVGRQITEEEYRLYVQPYEADRNLRESQE